MDKGARTDAAVEVHPDGKKGTYCGSEKPALATAMFLLPQMHTDGGKERETQMKELERFVNICVHPPSVSIREPT